MHKLCIAASLAVVFAGAASDAVAQEPILARARFDSAVFEAKMASAVEGSGFSGAIAVSQGGQIVYQQAFGWRDEADDLPNTIDTRFKAASVTKIVTASAVGVLYDQGKIDLDANIGSYLPGFAKLRPELAEKVTIRHLLNHSHGLGRYESKEFFEAASRIYTLADIYPFITGLEPQFEPGESYLYSNTGYVLLGLVIEAVHGTDFYQAVQDLVLDPLGMTSSGFWPLDEIVPNRARGYTMLSARTGEFGNHLLEARPWMSSRGGPGGGLYATVGDLLKLSGVLSGKVLLSVETAALFHSPTIERLSARDGELIEDSFYGYGVTINAPDKPEERLGHTGGDFGFASHLYYFPNYDLTYAVLSNRDTFSGASKGIDFTSAILESIRP